MIHPHHLANYDLANSVLRTPMLFKIRIAGLSYALVYKGVCIDSRNLDQEHCFWLLTVAKKSTPLLRNRATACSKVNANLKILSERQGTPQCLQNPRKRAGKK